MALEEILSLDVSDALSGIDEIERRITQAARDGSDALTASFSAALDQSISLVDQLGSKIEQAVTDGANAGADALRLAFDSIVVQVQVQADTTSADGTFSGLAPTTAATVAVDTTAIPEAQNLIEALNSTANVVVAVDDSAVTDAAGRVDALSELTPSVTVEVDDSQLSQDVVVEVTAVADTTAAEAALASIPTEITVTVEVVANADAALAELAAIPEAAAVTVSVEVDDSALADVQDQIDTLSGTAHVHVEVDAADLAALDEAIAGHPAAAASLQVEGSQLTDTASAIAALDTTVHVAVDVDTSSITEAVNLIEGIPPDVKVAVEVDSSPVTDLQQKADDLSNTTVTPTVALDATPVTDAVTAVEGLADRAVSLTINVDEGKLPEVVQQLDQINAEHQIDVTVNYGTTGQTPLDQGVTPAGGDTGGDTSGGDTGFGDETDPGLGVGGLHLGGLGGLGGGGGALERVSTTAAGTAEGFNLLDVAGRRVNETMGQTDLTAGGLLSRFGLAGAAAGTFAVGVDKITQSALQADAAQKRFVETLGKEPAARVSALQDIQGKGFTGDLETLGQKTGTKVGGLQQGISSFAQLGQQGGLGGDQIAEGGEKLALLASYVSAQKPQLGTAGDVINTLGLQLQRGGQRLQRYGIDIGSAADVSRKATQLFGVPTAALSAAQRQYAAIQLAIDKIGADKISAKIDQQAGTPLGKIRELRATIENIVNDSGKGLLNPLIDSLKSLAPAAEATVKIFTNMASGVFRVIGPEAKLLADALGAIGDVLSNKVVAGIVALGAGGIAAVAGLSKLLSVVERVGSALAGMVEGWISKSRDFAASSSSAFEGLATQGTKLERLSALSADLAAANERLAASHDLVTTAESGVAGAMERLAVATGVTTTATDEEIAAQELATAAVATNGEAMLSVLATEEGLAAAHEGEAAALAAVGEATAALTALLADEAATDEAVIVATGELAAAQDGLAVATERLDAANLLNGVTKGASAFAFLSTEISGATVAMVALAGTYELVKFAQDKMATNQKEYIEGTTKFIDKAKLAASFDPSLGPAGGISRTSTLDYAAQVAVGTDLTKGGSTASTALERTFGTTIGGFLEGPDTIPNRSAKTRQEAITKVGDAAVGIGGSQGLQILDDFSAALQKNGVHADQAAAAVKVYKDKINEAESATRAAVVATDAYAQSVDQLNKSKTAAEGEVSTATDVANIDAVYSAQAKLNKAKHDGVDASQAAITAQEYQSAVALKATAGFNALDTITKQNTEDTIKWGEASVATAQSQGDLVAADGQVVFTLDQLKSRLDTAADAFVNLLTKSQAMEQSTHSLDALLRQLGPTLEKNGVGIDANTAKYDLGKISADNYKTAEAFLSPDQQAKIEGTGKYAPKTGAAAAAATGLPVGATDAQKLAYDQAHLPTTTAAPGTPEYEAWAAVHGPKSTRTAGGAAAGKTDAQKAEEVKAALAGSTEAMTKATAAAADQADAVNKYFDQLGAAFRQQVAQGLKDGSLNEDQARAFLANDRDILIQKATAAGVKKPELQQILTQERLLPEQIDVDFKASGIDQVVTAIDQLIAVMSNLPADALTKALNTKDSKSQLDQVNKLIQQQKDIISDPKSSQDQVANAKAALDKIDALFNRSALVQQAKFPKRDDPANTAASKGVDIITAIKAEQDISTALHSLPTQQANDTQFSAAGVQALAEFDTEVERRKAKINSDKTISEQERKDELKKLDDSVATQRQALIKAIIDPTSLTAADQQLIDFAKTLTIHFKADFVGLVAPVDHTGDTTQPPGAGGAGTGAGGGSRPGAGGDQHPNQPGGGGPHGAKPPDPLPPPVSNFDAKTLNRLALPINTQPDGAQARGKDGWYYQYHAKSAQWIPHYDDPGTTNPTPHYAFAEGGVTFDLNDVELKRKTNLPVGEPGLHHPGEYLAAEASTQGEYLISRDPNVRTKNQGLVAAAAQDLGVRLGSIPGVQAGGSVVPPTPIHVAAPHVNVSSDPRLLEAMNGLARDVMRSASASRGPEALIKGDVTLISQSPRESAIDLIERLTDASLLSAYH